MQKMEHRKLFPIKIVAKGLVIDVFVVWTVGNFALFERPSAKWVS